MALTDGRVWPHETLDHQSVPVGVMAPVQLRFGADIDWEYWRTAPRLSVVGAQRVFATTM